MSTTPTNNTPITPEPEQEKPKRKPKIVPLFPTIKLVEPGLMLQSKRDLYYSMESDELEPILDSWHGAGGEAKFFSKGSSMMVVDEAQFISQGKVFVRFKLLCGDVAGWCNVVEISKMKKWDWMIPPKRKKFVREAFADTFDVIEMVNAESDEEVG